MCEKNAKWDPSARLSNQRNIFIHSKITQLPSLARAARSSKAEHLAMAKSVSVSAPGIANGGRSSPILGRLPTLSPPVRPACNHPPKQGAT